MPRGNGLGLLLGLLGGAAFGAHKNASDYNSELDAINSGLPDQAKLNLPRKGFFSFGNYDKEAMQQAGKNRYDQYSNVYTPQLDNKTYRDMAGAKYNALGYQDDGYGNYTKNSAYNGGTTTGFMIPPLMMSKAGNEQSLQNYGKLIEQANKYGQDQLAGSNYGRGIGMLLNNPGALNYGAATPIQQEQPLVGQQGQQPPQMFQSSPGYKSSNGRQHPGTMAWSDEQGYPIIQAGAQQQEPMKWNYLAPQDDQRYGDVFGLLGSPENASKAMSDINSIMTQNREQRTQNAVLPGQAADSVTKQYESQYAPQYYQGRAQEQQAKGKYQGPLMQSQITRNNRPPSGGRGPMPPAIQQTADYLNRVDPSGKRASEYIYNYGKHADSGMGIWGGGEDNSDVPNYFAPKRTSPPAQMPNPLVKSGFAQWKAGRR